MLTPSPVFPRKMWVANHRRRGFGQVSLPSTGMPRASSGAATFPRPFGLSGLGQCIPDPADPSTCYDVTGNVPTPPTTPPSTGLSPFWQSIIGGGVKTAQQIALQQSSYASPIYHLPPGYFLQQGPQGMVVSTSGVPVGGSALTTATMGNLLPILLVGGGLVVMMMAFRK